MTTIFGGLCSGFSVSYSQFFLERDKGITQFLLANQAKILLPYRVSMYIMTLYAVFGIGYSLANSYELDPLSGGILSDLAFLLTIIPVTVPAAGEAITALATETPELSDYLTSLPSGFWLPMGNLGSGGINQYEIFCWNRRRRNKDRVPLL